MRGSAYLGTGGLFALRLAVYRDSQMIQLLGPTALLNYGGKSVTSLPSEFNETIALAVSAPRHTMVYFFLVILPHMETYKRAASGLQNELLASQGCYINADNNPYPYMQQRPKTLTPTGI